MRAWMVVVWIVWMGSTASAATDVKSLWEKIHRQPKPPIRSLWGATQDEAGSPTVTKIEASKSSLSRTSVRKAHASQKLNEIARAITRAKEETRAINQALRALKHDLQKSRARYEKAKKSIDKFGGEIHNLDAVIHGKHEAYVRLLTEQFALITVLQKIDRSNVTSLVQQEVYRTYKKINAQQLNALKTKIDISRKAKEHLLTRQQEIENGIRSIIAQRTLYEKKKREKARLRIRLDKKKKEYRAQIKKIMQEQESLQRTLATLNILHKKEVVEAQRKAQAQRAEMARREAEQRRARLADESGSAPITVPTRGTHTVKKYGTSYQNNNVQVYRGARTISPLPHARVLKRFGSYIDPIYKIKIFNDNVVLTSSKRGAKIRNVLNGKVVYVGENSMLGKVVIIEHGHRLHTIYAALDKISPLLKYGSRVRKGAIVGRIKRKLIFQATQDSKYIDPLRLIRL